MGSRNQWHILTTRRKGYWRGSNKPGRGRKNMNMNKRTFLKACSAVLTSRVLSPLWMGSSNQKLTNWAGNFEYGTEKIYSAKSVQPVQDFVRNRNKFHQLPAGHSLLEI